MTVGEFFEDVVGLRSQSSDGYGWGIDDRETKDRLDDYIRREKRSRKGLSDATVRTKRTRLRRYAQTYRDCHGAADLIEPLQSVEEQPDEMRRVLTVFDVLGGELAESSLEQYLLTVDGFYKFLLGRGYAEFNPLHNKDEEFNFSTDTDDSREKPTPSVEQVSRLYQAATTDADRLMVVVLCGWGLRRGEVAALHSSQLALDGEDPHLAFESRKNGPGEVSILYGRELAEDRMVDLHEQGDWNGYLFPSRASESGHVHPDTITNRFTRLAERADTSIGGQHLTPHAARRFWYDTYSSVAEEVMKELQFVAGEQGSEDASVVRDEYLSDSRRRILRQQRMQDRMGERLSEAFAEVN
jgi:integrase